MKAFVNALVLLTAVAIPASAVAAVITGEWRWLIVTTVALVPFFAG